MFIFAGIAMNCMTTCFWDLQKCR